MKHRWFYNSHYLVWSCWAVGFTYRNGHGWRRDELTVYLGPLRLEWLR